MSSVPSDPRLQMIMLERGPASYSDEGEGPPILAIHGLPGSARDFRYLAPVVSPAARFVRVELPGFGATPVETAPEPSPLGRARYVVELASALGLERPLLVGHSMGGVVAVAAAELAPAAFSGLALISSPGVTTHAMLRRFPFARLDALLSRDLARRVAGPLLRRLFALGGFRHCTNAEVIRTIQCVAATSIEMHAERVARLEIPTLVAWCLDDPIIEPAIAEELADACPDGPRLRFPRGGHNPQKSHASELGAALLELLEPS